MKIYVDEKSPSGTSRENRYARYKAGNVGKSHSVARYPYTNRSAFGWTMGYEGGGYYYDAKWDRFALTANETQLMINRCISKFEGKCGASGSLGSSVFAEGKESVRMAVDRLESMAALVRAMRRKDFRALKRAWKKPKRPTHAMKNAGGKWLEFSFGWAPLVQTVFDGMKATGQDFPARKIHARDTVRGVKSKTSGYYRIIDTFTQSIKIGYDVKVTNPNTWLLGRLDLLNPGRWIWEAIPYSFFVDYFVNIGDMIHNLDSFAGLSFTNGYTTYYHKWEDYVIRLRGDPFERTGSGTFIRREGPTPLKRGLVFQQNPLTSSWQRGLNASSFLAQRLR